MRSNKTNGGRGRNVLSTATFSRVVVAGLTVALFGLLGAPPGHAAHEPTDVSVAKTASPDGPVSPGDSITYTITVANSHRSSSTKVITLKDVIPRGTTFVSMAGTFPYEDETWDEPGAPCTTPSVGKKGNVTCSGILFNVDPNTATFTLVVKVSAKAKGTITNRVTATLADDPDLTNNTAVTETPVRPTISA